MAKYMSKDEIKTLEAKLARLGDKGSQGKEKVEVLNDIADALSRSDPEKTETYGRQALALAEKLGFKEGIAGSFRIIGIAFLVRGDFDKALEYELEALRIFTEIGDKKGIASAYGNMGVIHKSRADYDRSLEYYFKALKIFEELGNKKNIATVYNNAGNIYYMQGDYDKALEYNQRTLKIRREIKDKQGIADCHSNMGIIYHNQGKNEEALKCHLKALKMRKELGDSRGIAGSYNNIGSIHVEQNDYDQALEYCLKALKIEEEIGNKLGIVTSCNSMGRTYIRLKRYDEALGYLQRGLEIAAEIGAKDMEMTAYQYLSELYEAQKNYEKTLDCYKKYQKLNEDIFSEESSGKINQLKFKYESERKEKEAEIFRLKNEELEKMVAERTAKLEAELSERKRIEEELKDKLTLIQQQRAAILELSTPSIKVWDGVLVIPLIGTLDTRRSQRLTEELLTSIGDTQSQIAIIDITGVPTVDSAVANHLLKTASSVRLMGAECVITGIRPEVAQTIIHLGIDLSNIETLSTLAEGLKWAFVRLKNI